MTDILNRNTLENKNKKKYEIIGNVLIHIALIFISIIMIFPFIWGILTSLKSFTEATHVPPIIFPSKFIWDNYTMICQQLPFPALYINTLTVIGVRIITTSIFSSLAAYAFARIIFPGRGILFIIVLMVNMVPSQIYIIPQFDIMLGLGWLNTVKALIVPGVVSAFGVFLLRQIYLNVPTDLEYAAKIDGCNQVQIFYHVMFPLSKTGIMSLGVFTALFAWGDLMWPLIVNSSSDKFTLNSGLATMSGGLIQVNYTQLMAGATIALVPMLVLFVLFQRQFIQGIAMTGIKG